MKGCQLLKKKLSEFVFGDMTLIYEIGTRSNNVGMLLVPTSLKDKISAEKRYRIDPIAHLKLIGDDYPDGFSQGITMRNSASTRNFRYVNQKLVDIGDGKTVVTTLRNNYNHELEHRVTWFHSYDSLFVENIFRNHGDKDVSLEMFSSFSLGGITPFIPGDSPNTLLIHQLKSKWSAEGRLHTSSAEELMLEPSWSKGGVFSHRFGQVGSMPARGYMPFLAIEDTKNSVSWGAQLAHAGSWQMEVYRRDDGLSISGGIADREFGHWVKNIKQGEEFVAPKGIISVTSGGVEQISQRLASFHEKWLKDKPLVEQDLPIIFNEYCSSWGQPSYENIKRVALELKNKGIKYFVIDCGWYSEEGKPWYLSMGDWNISPHLFPEGLHKVVEVIKDCGMIPGIWFEIENCGSKAEAFNQKEHFLKRDGYVISSGDRRFWDMKDPYVIEYLNEKVIEFIKTYGFGYLKIDYNDNFGIGCDGAESLGEGLRQQVIASQNFIKKIQTEIPDLVIENCASGGHRIEPSMIAISSMSSFSDAHECNEIPIIAANLHRMMLPRQNQIWAVVRKGDSPRRLYYSLSSTLLGRMCLSGDISELSKNQWGIIESGIAFYNKVKGIIKSGFSYRFGPDVGSYRHPRGWQGIFRLSNDRKQGLAVVHTFTRNNKDPIRVPIPEDLDLVIKAIYGERENNAEICDGEIILSGVGDFEAVSLLLTAKESNE